MSEPGALGGTAVRRVLTVAAVGLAALLGGCVQGSLMSRFQSKPDDISSKLTGEEGGSAGHAILYIKGACKDDDAPFPQLRRCRSVATSRKDPEHGAGVSVNRMFRNTGGVAPGERLTLAHLHAVEQEAIAQGIYKGVAFRPFPGATSDPDLPEFAARAGIGTDLALQFARSVFVLGYPSPRPC